MAYARPERPLLTQFGGVDSEEQPGALKAIASEVGVSPDEIIIAWLRQSSPSGLTILAGSKTR